MIRNFGSACDNLDLRVAVAAIAANGEDLTDPHGEAMELFKISFLIERLAAVDSGDVVEFRLLAVQPVAPLLLLRGIDGPKDEFANMHDIARIAHRRVHVFALRFGEQVQHQITTRRLPCLRTSFEGDTTVLDAEVSLPQAHALSG